MMKHPPYHLRTNKAIDRFMLVEAIRRLGSPRKLAQYTYHGFGGPYLDEFRLLYEYCPGMNMVSIEEDGEIYKKQNFHLPCGEILLKNIDFGSFLARYNPGEKKSIFWLDYNELKYSDFDEFKGLLSRVVSESIVKITLPANYRYYFHPKEEIRARLHREFQTKFGAVLPTPNAIIPRNIGGFVKLLQEMLRIAVQQALPIETGFIFQPISMFYYNDGTPMFTLTGMVCRKNDGAKIRSLFSDWDFANLDWRAPKEIDVPFLSTKERLHLQKYLPCKKGAERELLKKLGHLIDENESESLYKIKQYADFYKYYPHFLRTIPV